MTERKKLALKEGTTRTPATRAIRKTVSAKPQAAVAPDKGLKPVAVKTPRMKKVPLQAIVQTAITKYDADSTPMEFRTGGERFTARSQLRGRKMSKADKCYWAMHAVHELNRQTAWLLAGR